MIDTSNRLPVSCQTKLLKLSRASVYYQPAALSERELSLRRQLDELHLKYPAYGSRRLRDELEKRSLRIGRHQVRRLMRQIGIAAVYPRRSLSRPAKGHKIYPYLLRNLAITRPNQVWAADITYIPMQHGCLYLVAVMDWHSRKVLSWRLSNTLDTQFCLEALDEALARYGLPEIFNTDQGSQFTADAFTSRLKEAGIRISMDGKGRWLDNVFIERLWRSLKYDEVYLKAYETAFEAKKSIGVWLQEYNQERWHYGLNRRTPDAVYFSSSLPRQAA